MAHSVSSSAVDSPGGPITETSVAVVGNHRDIMTGDVPAFDQGRLRAMLSPNSMFERLIAGCVAGAERFIAETPGCTLRFAENFSPPTGKIDARRLLDDPADHLANGGR